ncbi:MAG: hypothetical protein AVDCRST_MAG96-472, partial [uncultured Segetibacter sp.]
PLSGQKGLKGNEKNSHLFLFLFLIKPIF